MKLVYQNLGTVWAIGVYVDDSEEMELTYNSLFNHGATSASMIKECDTFGYVLCQPEPEKKMFQYFVNSELHKLLNEADELQKNDPDAWAESCKGIKGGMMGQARINAEKRMEALKDSHECWMTNRSVNYFYSLGVISAEKPDPHSDCKD
jgi:hypothetical protein